MIKNDHINLGLFHRVIAMKATRRWNEPSERPGREVLKKATRSGEEIHGALRVTATARVVSNDLWNLMMKELKK
jgi:hypothetical protein